MRLKTILGATTLFLLGWFALAPAQPFNGANGGPPPPNYHHDSDNHHWQHHDKNKSARAADWYQGTRGQWYRDDNQWRWRTANGDQWYQGQPGHWYREPHGWQFGSTGMICNNQGVNCRVGGYLPSNGEGMVSRTNPNMFWHCDSQGHNCGWAHRPM